MKRQVVLIHGAWLTALSWENYERYFVEKGHEILVPEWPRKHGDVEQIRREAASVAGLGIKEIVDRLQTAIEPLAEPPIIIGHSFGGLFAQMLLDRGFGAAGVAIDPGPPKGILNLPLAALVSAAPVLLHPSKWNGVIELSLAQFTRGFVNTWSPEDAKAAYERYAVPETGRILFQAGTANFKPHSEATVNFHNDSRAPLLITGGEKDNTVPAALSRSIYKKQSASAARTDYIEFPGRPHFLMAGAGWEETADQIYDWLTRIGVTETAGEGATVS